MFPSSNQPDLATGWANILSAATAVRGIAASAVGALATTVGADVIMAYERALVAQRGVLLARVAQSGMPAYAQQMTANSGLDIVAEWNTMSTALNAVITWITTNFPKDGNGKLLFLHYDNNANEQLDTFTSAQTASLSTLMATLRDTIA